MFRKMKLTAKLAIIIGGSLSVILTILIIVTALLSKNAISQSIYGELTAISKSNGNQIQQIFSSAGSVATDMQSYLVKAFQTAKDDPAQMAVPTDLAAAAMCQSVLYHKTLTSLNYDVENYIVETARNAAKNNTDIIGVGVMFEPYAFQWDLKDYAFYIETSAADNPAQPYGAYEAYSAESFYQSAKEQKKTIVTDPYDYNGEQMVSFAAPIVFNDVVEGVIMVDIGLNRFNKVDATSDRYKSMFADIFNSKGEIVYSSQSAASVGATMNDFTADAVKVAHIQEQMAQGAAFQNEVLRSDTGKAVTLFFSPISAGSETWWSLTAVNTEDVNEGIVNTVLWMVLLSVAALALIVVSVYLVLKNMLAPMKGIVSAAEQIAEGNLEVKLTIKSQDEIGLLSTAFQKMSDRLKAMVGDLSYLLQEISSGNFDSHTKAEEAYVGEFRPMLLALRQMNQNLSDTMASIHQAADQVSSGSEQVSSGAQALSQGATEQASSLEELAATIGEISNKINNNAQSARVARTGVHEVGGKVEESNRQMQQMTGAMGEISASAGEIGKIIKAIEDIAFQTNILALNAAVEAARAGAAGKGFAVVADEVRSLAGKSSAASKSTSSLIENALSAVENGTRIADETAASLQAVVEGTKEITEQIKNIADASDEQAAAIGQITQGVDQISSVVQTNSATAEESAAASEELSGQAQVLKDLLGKFRLQGESNAKPSPIAKQLAPSSAWQADWDMGTDKY